MAPGVAAQAAVADAGAGLAISGVGLGVVLIASAVHLPLLRHAYRRRVDLIPPM